jgi:uncharacterized protein
MAQFQQSVRSAGLGLDAARIDEGLRAHMNKVYGLMSVGMLLTGAAAWAISGLAITSDPSMAVGQIGEGKYLNSFGALIYGSPLKWVLMFAPLIMVFAFGAVINRISAAGAQLYFYVYAAMMGVSLSSIFLVFTGESIAQTFLITAIAFAGLSLYGYTTKKDLSGMGTFLMMGLIGLVVAMIVNIFLGSGPLAFAISVIGLLIFAGLTAYDTQSIKNEYVEHAVHADQEWLGKSAIMGALRLYLDFINMFMFLLQFLGNRE